MTINHVGFVAYVAIIATGYSWFVHCNNATFRERDVVRKWLFKQPDWAARLSRWDEVSYGRHLFRRVLGLSWKGLYDEVVA